MMNMAAAASKRIWERSIHMTHAATESIRESQIANLPLQYRSVLELDSDNFGVKAKATAN